jgi:hypothetical protein
MHARVNVQADEFVLLSARCELRAMRSRTTLYTALTRLLAVDMTDDVFDEFMRPITGAPCAHSLCACICADGMRATSTQLAHGSVDRTSMCALIGLCRDVRGVCAALTTKGAYSLLFDWFYPHNFNVITNAIQVRACMRAPAFQHCNSSGTPSRL